MTSRVGVILLIACSLCYFYEVHFSYDHSQSELYRTPVTYHRLGVESVMKESNLSTVNRTSQPKLVTVFQPRTEIPPSTDYGKIVLSYPLFKPPISLPFSTPFSFCFDLNL